MNDIEQLMINAEIDDEEESSDRNSDDAVICQRCGSENDSGAIICWNCKQSIKLPTLGEFGKKLPIGVIVDEKKQLLNPRFDVIPLSIPVERAIQRYWTKRRSDLTLAEYVGAILAYTVTTVGDTDMTKLKLNRRLDVINSMFMGDVFYMYAYLRLISMGSELRINNIKCVSDRCGHRFNFPADVSSLSVVNIPSFEKLENTIILRDGFEIAGDIRKEIVVRPPLWKTMSEPSFGLSDQDMFETMLASAIVEIKGVGRGVALTSENFDRWTKPDIEYVREEFQYMAAAGPLWNIEGKCPECGTSFFFALDWMYERFFAHSFTYNPQSKL